MKSSFYNRENRPFRGLTLIELLVVAGLMVLLISMAAPVLNPVAEGRQAREAVRGIQGALETARSRAMRLGRPCGVAFTAFSTESSTDKEVTWYPVCIQLEQLTAPPDIQTTCTTSSQSITVLDTSMYQNPQKGDVLQINYTGPWYRNEGGKYTFSSCFPGTSTYSEFPSPKDGKYDCVVRQRPVPETTNPFAKILGLDPVFMIPKGIVVDLRYSGVGNSGTWGEVRSISIIFYPDGSVSSYCENKEASSGTSDNIFLLVGRWDRGVNAAEDGENNIQDPNSFWVVINSKTGMVTSAVNNASSNVSTAREIAVASVTTDTSMIPGGR
ncbi:MAG: hypothetical protein Q4D62_13355 [Planctomycetia bacterium]|nr:hypothetical protein [Planctomycetia bacterium]